jgi:hypothetical protein
MVETNGYSISADNLLASAVNYLIHGKEHDIATALLMCKITLDGANWDNGLIVRLSGPRAVYEMLLGEENPIGEAATRAFNAVLPGAFYVDGLSVTAEYLDTLDPNWRTELLEIASGRGVHNQAVEIPNRTTVTWNNLRFRSEPERRIAIALDTAGAMFLPNCLARLSNGTARTTREADFLVCHNGQWGVLEVDGPFHPRAAVDHERDRLFQAHGIRVTQRFDWEECRDDAPGVVRKFLTLLAKNG